MTAGAPRRLGVGAAVVGGRILPGDVTVDGAKIAAVGVVPAGDGGVAVPGFVDIQVNGFAGVDFSAPGPAGYATVAAPLAATGVTAYLPTLISLPESTVVAALHDLAAADDRGGPRILGAHLEGPFLAASRHGAHDRRNVVPPDPDLAGRLLAAGPVRMTTLAPEVPGALDLIEFFVARGIVVACGHSDATAAEAREGFRRGGDVVTHLFKAQRPISPREPGVIGAGHDSDVTVTIIVDGFHLAPETVRITMAAARGRVALITDAVSASGLGDGSHRLGDRTVEASGGAVRLDDGTLAGSVLTMDRAVRNLVDLGVSFEEAVTAASEVPARAIRRTDLGDLTPGGPADVTVLDDSLTVVRTLVAGDEIHAA